MKTPAVAAGYPTISFSAAIGFDSSSVSNGLPWSRRFWSVGPSISSVFERSK
jgi:outer membrane protein TolC